MCNKEFTSLSSNQVLSNPGRTSKIQSYEGLVFLSKNGHYNKDFFCDLKFYKFHPDFTLLKPVIGVQLNKRWLVQLNCEIFLITTFSNILKADWRIGYKFFSRIFKSFAPIFAREQEASCCWYLNNIVLLGSSRSIASLSRDKLNAEGFRGQVDSWLVLLQIRKRVSGRRPDWEVLQHGGEQQEHVLSCERLRGTQSFAWNNDDCQQFYQQNYYRQHFLVYEYTLYLHPTL